MNIISIFVFGVGILVGALILNFFASTLGLMSWYDFLKNSHKASWISYLWLFIIYPLGLGFAGYLLSRLITF